MGPDRPRNRSSIAGFALAAVMGASAGVASCHGCRTQSVTTAPDGATPAAATLRLYALSPVAGALEPCGCSKDQLGGIDHLAAFVSTQKTLAPEDLVVEAGPFFFSDPSIKGDQATQQTWKAEALGRAA